MKIIGITGPTGAGKSLLSEYLSQTGIPVIDADGVYHELLVPPSPCLDALRSVFGDGVFYENGALNRSALSEIVFHDAAQLEQLNRTVLGFVLDDIRERIRRLAAEGHAVVAVDAPTLIESGFHEECDAVISVLASADVRKGRIMARDGLSEERAEARIRGQKSDEFYREHSHRVLVNDDEGAEQLREQARTLLSTPFFTH